METDRQTTVDRLYPEWEKFINGHSNGVAGIRRPILHSWQRCLQAGVDPHETKEHSSLDAVKQQDLLQRKEQLIRIAKPVMQNLYKFVKGSGFVVVLTDETGYILDMLGDEDTLQNRMTSDFFCGASWREEAAGTNAIGTALIIGEPLQVSGAEHFCQKHHALTCSAAPIFSQGGKLIGILDISGSIRSSHLHTLGMVVAAAEAIMAQIAIGQKNYELAMINKRLTNFFNTVSDGALIVDKDGVITELNPAAAAMLGHSGHGVRGTPLSGLFGDTTSGREKKLTIGKSYADVEIMVETKAGVCHCVASGEPIMNEQGVVAGGVVILRPIQQVQNLVNRFSGYYASLQFSDVIGNSEEIRETVRLASLSATTNCNILLQGESGTGKEIFAQSIHNRSAQHNGPFIALNCGAIPCELIGSELFGYEDGAFTGAKRGGKPGKFELASGGTLFLDEIGDMPLEQQAALLRVIQEKKVARIGSTKMIPVNVRLICATNKNLLHEVEKGAFRQDLFYRLNVMSIYMPPLRSRMSDIPLLFQHFVEKLCRDWNCKLTAEPEVMERLLQYHWPGNVRELQNIVERAASLAENGVITLRHLPAELNGGARIPVAVDDGRPEEAFDCREQRKQVARESEKQKILSLLNLYAGNVSKVARTLGVSRKTLYNKMHSYSILN